MRIVKEKNVKENNVKWLALPIRDITTYSEVGLFNIIKKGCYPVEYVRETYIKLEAYTEVMNRYRFVLIPDCRRNRIRSSYIWKF